MFEYTVSSLHGPRRVRLQFQTERYKAEQEVAPLAAAHLAGLLFFAALELVDPERRMGVHPTDSAPVTVWTPGTVPEIGWLPEFFTDANKLRAHVAQLRADGIPYRVSIDLVTDPLQEPTERPG